MAKKQTKTTYNIPVHPGSVLQLAIDELGITQSAMANHLGLKQSYVNEICRGRRGISAEMAVKLGRALEQDPHFWLNLQNAWELSQIDFEKFEGIDPIAA